MQLGHIHCQVVDTTDLDHLAPRDEGQWPRDLLPWADPYVASLMLKLHRHRGETEGLLDDEFAQYQFAADQWLGDDWKTAELDSPASLRIDLSPRNEYPPIYGGFPLLEDLDA